MVKPFSNEETYRSEVEYLKIKEIKHKSNKALDKTIPDFEDEIIIKSPNKFYIYCEGKEEHNYFSIFEHYLEKTNRLNIIKDYPNKGFNPNIKKEGYDSKSLIEQFLKAKTKLSKDIIVNDKFFLVFDRDNNHCEPKTGKNHLEYTIEKSLKEHIVPIFSNPCFEVWLISQYQQILCETIPFKSDEVKVLLKQVKLQKRLNFEDKLRNAKFNSKELYNKQIEKRTKVHSEESFPITEVFKLIEILEEEFKK